MKSIFKTKQETFPYSEISCISKRTRGAFIHLKNGSQIELDTIEAESLEENWLHWIEGTEVDPIKTITSSPTFLERMPYESSGDYNKRVAELEAIILDAINEGFANDSIYNVARHVADVVSGLLSKSYPPTNEIDQKISGIISAEENKLGAFLSEALHSNLAKDGINPVKFGRKLAKQFFEANPLK